MIAHLSNLLERALLTLRYHGVRSLVLRLLSYPLRFTPLGSLLPFGPSLGDEQRRAMRWYVRHGRRVTIVIPSFRDAEYVRALIASLRRTTFRPLVRIVVADDASGETHLRELRAIRGIRVLEGRSNSGFAANANRGLAAADPRDDVVLLNSDTVARPGWLACLQRCAYAHPRNAIAGAKLLYPDGRIQFAGTVRNLGAPAWFDHRYRFRPANWPPATVPQPAVAVTGACMYLRRDAIGILGGFDEGFPMAFEDIDICLRAWVAGRRVVYCPSSELDHLESVTRGTVQGPDEQASQDLFWRKWGSFLDRRDVRAKPAALRVIYVCEGHDPEGRRTVCSLRERGHQAALWRVAAEAAADDVEVPAGCGAGGRIFPTLADLAGALADEQALKIVSSTALSALVWEASMLRGIPVFLASEADVPVAPDDPRAAFLRHEFRYLTAAPAAFRRLLELGLEARLLAEATPPELEAALLEIAAPRRVPVAAGGPELQRPGVSRRDE